MKYTCVSEILAFPNPIVKEGFSFLSIMGYDSRCFQIDCEAEKDETLCNAFGIPLPSKLQSKSISSSWEIRGFTDCFDFRLVLDTFYVNYVRAETDPSQTRNNLYEALFKAPYTLEVHTKKELPSQFVETGIATSVKLLLDKVI